jgi:hypothetical protein
MTISTDDLSSLYGFLSVVEMSDIGFCGGLLVLDRVGRPIEFHCTVPVKPDRAQEILFGRTLKHHLFCDQIGTALLQKCTQQLSLIFVDQFELLDLAQPQRFDIAIPLAMPLVADEIEHQKTTNCHGTELTIGSQRFAVPDCHEKQTEAIEQRLLGFSFAPFVCEPFDRIREAIEEAQSACA